MRADILRGLAVAALPAVASAILARPSVACKNYNGVTDDLPERSDAVQERHAVRARLSSR
jgi:hypothetical protein